MQLAERTIKGDEWSVPLKATLGSVRCHTIKDDGLLGIIVEPPGNNSGFRAVQALH